MNRYTMTWMCMYFTNLHWQQKDSLSLRNHWIISLDVIQDYITGYEVTRATTKWDGRVVVYIYV